MMNLTGGVHGKNFETINNGYVVGDETKKIQYFNEKQALSLQNKTKQEAE